MPAPLAAATILVMGADGNERTGYAAADAAASDPAAADPGAADPAAADPGAADPAAADPAAATSAAVDFDFALERKAEVPIGVQLVWAIRTRILDGRFPHGSRLPALRDVAASLGLNANTVRAAYARLEHQGLVESRHGSGTFVTAAPLGDEASAIATQAAEQAQQRGVDPREVAAALYSSATGRADDPELARRRTLRAQIATLQQALDELRLAHPGATGLDAADERRKPGSPRLPTAAELEQTRLDLLRRLGRAHAAVDDLARACEPERPESEPEPEREQARGKRPAARHGPKTQVTTKTKATTKKTRRGGPSAAMS